MSGLDLSSARRSTRPGSLDFVLLALSVLAVAFVLGSFLRLRNARERVEGDLRRAEEQALDLEKRVHSLEGRPSEGPAGGLASPAEVVELVAGLLPDDARLVDFSLSYGKAVGVEMHIVAHRAASYDLFLDKLQGSKRFKRIVPGPESRDQDVTGSIRAEIGESP